MSWEVGTRVPSVADTKMSVPCGTPDTSIGCVNLPISLELA
ncbi:MULTISPECIES: hypothetical protein [Bacillus]|nr:MULTISPECIES: hypothetical protein [Bacillus]